MIGRKYQSHERYEENFVTVVEFFFDEHHLSSSSIGGGRILCSKQKNRLKRSSCPDNLFSDMLRIAVNAPACQGAKAFTGSNQIASFKSNFVRLGTA